MYYLAIPLMIAGVYYSYRIIKRIDSEIKMNEATRLLEHALNKKDK